MQKQLSQFFRNHRRYSKALLNPKLEKQGKECNVPAVKKAKVVPVDDQEAQSRNLKLLKDYKVGVISGKTYATLVNETFQARRDFIKNIASSCSEILDLCPYLGKADHVRIFLYIIIFIIIHPDHALLNLSVWRLRDSSILCSHLCRN